MSVAFTSQNIVASRTKLFSRSFKLKEEQEEEAIFPGHRFHDFRSKGSRFSNMPAEWEKNLTEEKNKTKNSYFKLETTKTCPHESKIAYKQKLKNIIVSKNVLLKIQFYRPPRFWKPRGKYCIGQKSISVIRHCLGCFLKKQISEVKILKTWFFDTTCWKKKVNTMSGVTNFICSQSTNVNISLAVGF